MMTFEDASVIAETWLRSHGYDKWPDGDWNYNGYEADPQQALAEYIEEKSNE